MSGESATHLRLVERLIEHVRTVHRPERGLLILADHHSFGSDRPRTVDGYTPDVFASDLPVTFEVLGEAKTLPDLQTPRSSRQIRAFLDHLAVRPNATFYLFVPPFARAASISVVRLLLLPQHECINIEVIDGL